MFGRRAGDEDIRLAVVDQFPGAPSDLVDAVLAAPERPRRADAATWVRDQVDLEAGRRLAVASGLADAPFPPDGAEALRVYLDEDLADADVDVVGAARWAAARAEAWGDHPDGLTVDRAAWWRDSAEDAVSELVGRWRVG